MTHHDRNHRRSTKIQYESAEFERVYRATKQAWNTWQIGPVYRCTCGGYWIQTEGEYRFPLEHFVMDKPSHSSS